MSRPFPPPLPMLRKKVPLLGEKRSERPAVDDGRAGRPHVVSVVAGHRAGVDGCGLAGPTSASERARLVRGVIHAPIGAFCANIARRVAKEHLGALRQAIRVRRCS